MKLRLFLYFLICFMLANFVLAEDVTISLIAEDTTTNIPKGNFEVGENIRIKIILEENDLMYDQMTLLAPIVRILVSGDPNQEYINFGSIQPETTATVTNNLVFDDGINYNAWNNNDGPGFEITKNIGAYASEISANQNLLGAFTVTATSATPLTSNLELSVHGLTKILSDYDLFDDIETVYTFNSDPLIITITGGAQPACGDGTIDAGEQCDDGNTVAGDGCSATCETEVQTKSFLLFGCKSSGWAEGGTYILSNDIINNVGASCMLINKNDVTLDCQGKKIIARSTKYGEGIYLNMVTGVTIKNCNVSNFGSGIVSFVSNSNTLVDNTFSGNGDGISLIKSQNNVLTGNTVCDNINKDLRCDTGSTGTSGIGNVLTQFSDGCTVNNWPVLNDDYTECPIPDAACGNQQLETGETCDSDTKPCTAINSNLYESGDAPCKSDCSGYDPTNCVTVPLLNCGNGNIEGQEICDSDTKQCSEVDPQYTTGTATCLNDCTGYDIDNCYGPDCGNGLVEADEECDDGNSRNGDGCTTGCIIEEGYICSGGDDGLAPSNCVSVEGTTPGEQIDIILVDSGIDINNKTPKQNLNLSLFSQIVAVLKEWFT